MIFGELVPTHRTDARALAFPDHAPEAGLEVISDNCYATYQIPAADFNRRDRTSGALRTAAIDPGLEGERSGLNTTIMLFLLQDGITNGAVYALLGLALVLVFARHAP